MLDDIGKVLLSSIIVNSRTPNMVIGCIESLLLELMTISSNVVVDNASGDDSTQKSCFHYISPTSEFISVAQTGFITRLLKKYNVLISITDKVSMYA